MNTTCHPVLGASIALAFTSFGLSAATTYSSNGNAGFGGVLDELLISDDGTNLTFSLSTGNSLNDKFVLYIDSVAGGENNTGGYTDTGDPLRNAISGFDGTNRSTVTVPAGFGIDYAIALDSGFAGLWETVDAGSHTFVNTANGSTGGATASPYVMTVALADLGLSAGDTFTFVGTYTSDTAFRSDEAFGDGLAMGNPGQSPVTFTSSLSYTTIPEPSAALLGGLGMLSLLRRRRA
ncbi:hypothetical protein [Roseibacillus persicicus]|uniref:hypothetical protein n=1 Tax=Roseibacillus persicicus TaxID=454148 RepID=UPI00280DDB84|nr:hypothetical protein [Roseibacillus persicicus]MDQ8190552.1 hypothetical protein [Roseibacillus persicicus]